MARFFKKTPKKPGASPGLVVEHASAVKGETPGIRLIVYSENSFEEKQVHTLDEVFAQAGKGQMVWMHVSGPQNPVILARLGELFQIHPLTLEDVANPGHRPKFEEFDTYVFMVFKHLSRPAETKEVLALQTSFIAGQDFLISFQDAPGMFPCFESVKKRIQTKRKRIRKSGSDYLAYALADAVVDHYLHVLAELGDEIETLEGQMLDHVEPGHLERIHELKREMIFIRKQIWPAREAVGRFIKSESDLVKESTHIFLSDVYDHLIHTLDTIDSFRDLLSSMLELYMSDQSNRMNEVMRTLTIIATIFIPLTFIAGIYGMNFKIMPELEWGWGYFGALGVMAILAGAMVIYFKRKNWF